MRNFPNFFAVRNLVKREALPEYNRKYALMSGVGLIRGAEVYQQHIDALEKTHPNLWHVQLNCKGKTADLPRIVPSIFVSFNKSRILRRLKISGIRACNLLHDHDDCSRYLCDLTFLDVLGVRCFTAAVQDYFKLPNQIRARFRYPRIRRGPARSMLRNETIEAIYRHVGVPKSKMYITEKLDDFDERSKDYACYELIIDCNTINMYNVVAALDTLPLLIEFTVSNILRCSRHQLFEPENYVEHFAHRHLLPTYKHFQAFGELHNHPHFIVR